MEAHKEAKLLLEDKILTKYYLHSDKFNMSQLGDSLNLKKDALREFSYALNEVEFLLEVDIKTGDTKILEVNGIELKK